MTLSPTDRTKLSALDPNLTNGVVANPTLRYEVFHELYTYLDSIIADSNAAQGAGAVTTTKLADGSVVTVKLADLGVTTGKVADGAIVTVKLADGSVTTLKIADGSITTAKLAAGSVTLDKLSPDIQTSGQPEVALARVSVPSNKTYTTLKARLDDEIGILSGLQISVESYPIISPEVDDAPRIQRAIDAASAQGGGIVKFDAQTYTINSTALHLKSKVKLQGAGAKSTIISSNSTGTVLYIQGSGSPYEWMGLRDLMIQATNVTNAPIVYMDAAYYVEFTDVNIFGNSASIQTGSIGIHILGTNTGYYAMFTRTQSAFVDTGFKLEDSSNAHHFIGSWSYGCNIGMQISDSNGINVLGHTFQDFNTKAIVLTDSGSGKCHANTILGSYIEYKIGSSTINCGIDIGTGVRTTMLYGNNYSNLRPTYQEVVDNGTFTTRLEWSGTSYFETMKIPNFMIPPTFEEASKPVVDSRFRGALSLTTEATKQDKLRAIVQDKNGVMQWVEIPYVVSGVLNMPGNSAIQNGAIYQFNDGYVLLGTMVSAQERALNYDTGFKKIRYHNGTAWKYLPGVDSGTTANRPTGAAVLVGQEYFDTTLSKPIWCKTSGSTPTWVDATGTTV